MFRQRLTGVLAVLMSRSVSGGMVVNKDVACLVNARQLLVLRKWEHL